jgi:glycosyltransferase involved in cell wall biosynthesis
MVRVLMIPSWYPTVKKPIEGSFFQEQAIAMLHKYEIKIFYPEKIEANPFSRLFNTLLFILKINPTIEFVNDNYANYPEKYFFYYKGGIRILKLEENIFRWQCIAAFKKIIETGWKPDLIHAQCTIFGGITSYFISEKHKLPYIITEHNLFLLHNYTNTVKRLLKLALENAKIVISVSEHQKRMILMHNINCRPVVVGNLIDENIFKIAPKQHEIFTILYISFDSYIKDNETFFKAVKLFQQKSKEPFMVKVLGRNLNSNQKNHFLSLGEEYELNDQLEVLEFVERDKIIKYFQSSDVFVSSSIAETFGVSMCEALFCGIPIISTTNGGVDEMINNKNGIKVNIQDESAICEALLKIYNKEIVFDPQEIRKTVINKFSREVFVKKIDAIYTSIIDSK